MLLNVHGGEMARLLRDGQSGDDDDDELMLNVLRCHLTY